MQAARSSIPVIYRETARRQKIAARLVAQF
jgi:hypothetical protein